MNGINIRISIVLLLFILVYFTIDINTPTQVIGWSILFLLAILPIVGIIVVDKLKQEEEEEEKRKKVAKRVRKGQMQWKV